MIKNNEIMDIILKKLQNNKMNINKLSSIISLPKEEIKTILEDLKNDLLIKEENGFYSSTIDDYHKIGTLKMINPTLGMVKISENEIYFVDSSSLGKCIDGDTVLINITNSFLRTAIILDKKEELRKCVGTVYLNKDKFCVNFDNPLLRAKMKLDKNGPFKDGDKVYVEFLSQKDRKSFTALNVEVLGKENEVGIDITSIIKELGIEDKFSEKVLEETKTIKQQVDEVDLKGRKDLRNENIFTIDGNESKDFDDAIGIKVLDNNHYLVKVCIADVDHYVKEGSILDKIAQNRGASCYLLDRTIPMLPQELSNGICSLNPLEDRLTVTYEMEFDENGEQVNYDIYLSVIHSKVRMTYERVEDVLQNDNSEYYKEFQNELRLLHRLSKKIHNIRQKNGFIELEKPARKIIYDNKKGKISKIFLEDRKESEKLIEEFMIAANKSGTLYAENNNIPIIRRVQDDEEVEEIYEKLETLTKMGFKNFDFPLYCSNNDIIKEVLEYYKEDENFETVKRIITNQNRAYYTSEKRIHSSLNEENYSHLTSPIRRYSDLYSSRQIKKYLRKEKIEEKAIIEVLEQINRESEKIRLCDLRQVGLKVGEYYQEKNEIMRAKVININEKFITIQLEDLTTGVILIKKLKDYRFDSYNYSIRNNQDSIKIGDYIEVKVIDVDKYLGKTNYEILKLEKTKK